MSGKQTGTLELLTPADQITFGSTIEIEFSTENVALPATYMRCYEPGTNNLIGASGGYPPRTEFQCGPTQIWTEGEADGHLTLEVADPQSRGKTKVLAEVDFHVNA